MGLFSRKKQDLSIPANRQVNMNPSGKKLEWIDAVNLWEIDYYQLHKQHGWKLIPSGDKNSNNRFEPYLWNVDGVGVLATFDSYTGIVTEEIVLKN
jgi:hypothetical protein